MSLRARLALKEFHFWFLLKKSWTPTLTPLLAFHLEAEVSFPAATPPSPSPGTRTLPSIPSGDHASTIAFAILPMVNWASLSAVQLLSTFSYVKIEITIGPLLPATIATSLRTAFRLPVLLAIAEPSSLESSFSRYRGMVSR